MMQAYMIKDAEKIENNVASSACCYRNCLNSISLHSQKNVSNLFEWEKVEATSVDDSSASCVVATSHDENVT
jgi:hypothetical protein